MLFRSVELVTGCANIEFLAAGQLGEAHVREAHRLDARPFGGVLRQAFLLDVRPLIRLMISLGARVGGQLVRMCTWSLLTTPFTIRISNASHVSHTNSGTRSAISPVSTW
mgnify:CR=1 FL=1